MAARFGATIVPFAGVGLDDGFEMLLSPQEIRNIPVLGKWLEDSAKKQIPPARRYASAAIVLILADQDDMEVFLVQFLRKTLCFLITAVRYIRVIVLMSCQSSHVPLCVMHMTSAQPLIMSCSDCVVAACWQSNWCLIIHCPAC